MQSISLRPGKKWRRGIQDGGGDDDALVKVAVVAAKEMNEDLLQELEQRWQASHDLSIAVGCRRPCCGAHVGQIVLFWH